MNTHLQYYLDDSINNITESNGLKINMVENSNRLYEKLIIEDNILTLFKYNKSEESYHLNKEMLEVYSTYTDNLKTIRKDTDDTIKNFISKNGRIRDLLYRMNTMDPIEREYNNRSMQLVTLNDNFNNFVGNYKNSGKDDMVTNGIMNHEINAILLYLLNGSNVKIQIDYNISKIFNYIYRVSGLKEIIEVDDKININPIPSYKWFLLQSLYDSKYVNKIPFICDLSKENQSNYIVNGKDYTLGKVHFNKDVYCSLAMLILRLYKHNKLFERENIHNMCRIPVCMLHNYLSNYGDINTIKILQKMYVNDEFRKIMHTMTIILYQLIVFNFMDYIMKLSNITESTKIQNVVDNHLFSNRLFQKLWIIIEERYSSEEIFKLFKEFIVTFLVEES